MKINNCPACGGAAAIRYKKDTRRHCFRVWIQCGQCGRRTRDFSDMQEPDTGSGGGKWAAIAWNSGDNGGPGGLKSLAAVKRPQGAETILQEA